MTIKKVDLCLNIDDPEQKALHEFLTVLPNGKKRNTSGFLRTMADRVYQTQKDEYLSAKMKFEQEKKAPKAPLVTKSKDGEIKFTWDG